tara:strand:+ start:64 stop:309 length:246 start_codon:yes stop_codon:yes gene_type:complete
MQSELNGEVRSVIRNRRGVIWCPFCDTSSVLTGDLVRCASCSAAFSDEATEVIAAEAPPRRRRASAEETVAVEEPEDDPSP